MMLVYGFSSFGKCSGYFRKSKGYESVYTKTSQFYKYSRIKKQQKEYVKMFLVLILWGLVSQVIFPPTSFIFPLIPIFSVVTRYYQENN